MKRPIPAPKEMVEKMKRLAALPQVSYEQALLQTINSQRQMAGETPIKNLEDYLKTK